MSLFDTGVRPAIDNYLLEKSKEVRSYGDYWSASSAFYCMRKNIFERLGVPPVTEDARKQRVFSSGHIFHEWIQNITKQAGLSIAQELELQDEELMIRGHIDDLVLVPDYMDGLHKYAEASPDMEKIEKVKVAQHLILYDYKTQNSKNFAGYAKNPNYYHRGQLGTYMYMLRKLAKKISELIERPDLYELILNLLEARILKISKDDLRMAEVQYMWTDELEREVIDYWTSLNKYWAEKKIPPCTCADHENGFMAREGWNPYFYNGSPCSIEYYNEWKESKKEATV